MFATGFMVKALVIEITNVWDGPVQPEPAGVTMRVDVPFVAELKLIFPVPLAAKPMAVLEFSQL